MKVAAPSAVFRSVTAAMTVFFSLALSTTPFASSFDNKPKILLHAQEVTTKSAACAAGALSDCQDAVTEAPLISGSANYQFVYVLTAKGSLTDVTGLSFGISYQENCPDNDLDKLGIDIYSWHLCATLEFPMPSPSWPKPYSGNIVTWDPQSRCQTGDVGVAGYFYCGAYSDDDLQVISRPLDPKARLATCAGGEVALNEEDLGFVAFSSGEATPGCNPCDGPCPGPLIPPPPPPCQIPPPPPPPPPAPGSAAILVHLTSVTTKNACATGALEACSTAVIKGGLSTPGEGPYYFAHLLTNRGTMPSIAGLQCGISYDNNLADGASNGSRIDVFSWTLCATLEFQMPSPAWPAPGSGNLITWDPDNNCQTGSTAVAGYFYLAAYSPDILRVTPRPVDGEAKLANCESAETPLPESRLGFAAFSAGESTAGCNPCVMDCAQAVPVQSTTWSGVKTLFR